MSRDLASDGRPILEEREPLRPAPLRVRLAARLATLLLRLAALTWRVEWIRRDVVAQWAERGVIFAFWHGLSLVPAWTWRNRGVVVMVSQHRDGEIMNRALAYLGYRRVRGSSTRGGRAAMAAMIQLLRQGRSVAVTPDGPRGPLHSVHPGVLLLAARTGAPILPCAIEARAGWRLRSWDRYLIPRPGTRIRIAVGEPFFVGGELDRAQLAEDTERLKTALARLHEEASYPRRDVKP